MRIMHSLLLILATVFLLISSCSKDKPTASAPANTVTDIDGNVYQTVTIGTQVWMKENLKVTRYRNGDSIPNLTDPNLWPILAIGLYCNYNNDPALGAINGRLYNWYAIGNAVNNIAPVGWHVPSDAEWQTLVDYLGVDSAGAKLKEAGTLNWDSPNVATNESGFSALGSGGRGLSGSYSGFRVAAVFWTTSPQMSSTSTAYYRRMSNDAVNVTGASASNQWGYAVRCVKD